ncbi:polyamine ABC transporter substrate-binding protein [Inquilinus sp. Marseille-Q2685]|uniref:polyamine ABC transporter substrate-binding protein n=1 Tax=Inquilinus sp. Marseille-Q2685 TaxID=2866581 RepID=UPI001CE49692|nr:polyamine ABC transporter substrate-binding protein [Inquilinus sp. Marseille-Q2685]
MISIRMAAGATLALLGSSAALAETPTLTISVYGVAQDAYRKDLYDPFEAICGCKLVVETGNSSERLAKLEANKASPVIDVAAIADFNALEAARKDLIQPIDVSKLSNYGALYDFAQDPIGGHLAVGYTFYSTSIVYRSDKVSISSWKDLFKPELAGRIALPNITTTQGPLAIYMIDKAEGGTTPDLKAGIDAVAAHREDVVTFYERGSQIPQLFEQEEILAAVVGRFGWANIKKLDLPIQWATPSEGQTGGMNVLTLVKGSRNEELALKFIDYWLSKEVQTRLAMDLVDSPANRTVEVPPETAEALTYGAETAASLSFIKPVAMLENREAWVAGWNAKVAQ